MFIGCRLINLRFIINKALIGAPGLDSTADWFIYIINNQGPAPVQAHCPRRGSTAASMRSVLNNVECAGVLMRAAVVSRPRTHRCTLTGDTLPF